MKLQYFQTPIVVDGRNRVIQPKWRWRLVAKNGKAIADGKDSYVNEGNVKRVCRKVQALFKNNSVKIEKVEQ